MRISNPSVRFYLYHTLATLIYILIFLPVAAVSIATVAEGEKWGMPSYLKWMLIVVLLGLGVWELLWAYRIAKRIMKMN